MEERDVAGRRGAAVSIEWRAFGRAPPKSHPLDGAVYDYPLHVVWSDGNLYHSNTNRVVHLHLRTSRHRALFFGGLTMMTAQR